MHGMVMVIVFSPQGWWALSQSTTKTPYGKHEGQGVEKRIINNQVFTYMF